MQAIDLIIKKRDRQELSKEEIDFFINRYTQGEIPDYQMSALAMAILLNGMNARETTDLTLAMAYSGEVLDLSEIVPFAIDKHSTGGVGDKTTLVVEPIVAAYGLPIAKMSGRGLGFSGGTLDKLESIPGYRTNLSPIEFLDQLRKIGMVLTGQSVNLAPADGKLYALRDVTGTVQSMPLIASSVMSKKIAAGANGIILDVKWGLGAFMRTLDEARELANLMVDIARLSGRKSVAVLSDMNQPLGNAVGNALELVEAIETLHNRGPEDFREHCLVIAGYMLVLGGKAKTESDGKEMASQALRNGQAWGKFRTLVAAQGGDVSYIDLPSKLPRSNIIKTVLSPKSGYLKEINARKIGEATILLGAGRMQKEDKIDPGVGVIVHHKVGDLVEFGEPLMEIHSNKFELVETLERKLLDACIFQVQTVKPLPLFYGIVR